MNSTETTIINPNNSIRAESTGECKISVKLLKRVLMGTVGDEDEEIAEDSITVTVINSISTEPIITTITANMFTGQTTKIPINDVDSDTQITWSSSNPNIVSVATDGTITTIMEGTVTLTASYTNNLGQQVIANYEITVTDNEEDPNAVKEHILQSLIVNGNSIVINNIMATEINSETLRIEAIPNVSEDIVKIKYGTEEYDSPFEKTWIYESSQVQFYIDVCVANETDNCRRYTLSITNNNNIVDDEEENFFESFKINNEDINIETFFNCNSAGTQRTCEGSYTLPSSLNSVVVSAELKNGYSFKEPRTPGEYASNVGHIYLEIQKASSTVAIYSIEVKTTLPNSDPPSSVPTSNPDASVRPIQTGDMSSILIFMIMIVSLLASMIIYKKNISE